MDKIRILMVDNEEDFLFVMKKQLESWGYEVITASSGKEAVDSVVNSKPDIMILDYHMPEMNGMETLREIRKTNNKIPVVMFTGDAQDVPIKGRGDLGINAFILKACDESALKIAISSLEKKIEKK